MRVNRDGGVREYFRRGALNLSTLSQFPRSGMNLGLRLGPALRLVKAAPAARPCCTAPWRLAGDRRHSTVAAAMSAEEIAAQKAAAAGVGGEHMPAHASACSGSAESSTFGQIEPANHTVAAGC